MLRHGTCLDAGPRLDDLCDGELNLRHERRIRRHIAGCSFCRRRLHRLQATLDDLTHLGRRPPVTTPSVRDRVAAALAADPGPPPEAPRADVPTEPPNDPQAEPPNDPQAEPPNDPIRRQG